MLEVLFLQSDRSCEIICIKMYNASCAIVRRSILRIKLQLNCLSTNHLCNIFSVVMTAQLVKEKAFSCKRFSIGLACEMVGSSENMTASEEPDRAVLHSFTDEEWKSR